MGKIKLGLLPRQGDTLVSNLDEDKYNIYYLICSNSPELDWCRKFLPQNRILLYQLNNPPRPINDLTFAEIIEYSNFTEIVNSNEVNYLFIDVSSEYLNSWAKVNDIQLIVTPYELKERFENKIIFDEFLDSYKIEKPKSKIVKFNHNHIKLPFQKKFVLQNPISMFGEGTYFIDNINDLNKLFNGGQIREEETMLAREYIKGRTYGISVFICSGMIILSSIRLQCFTNHMYSSRNIFLGLQWIPYSQISNKVIININMIFQKLGVVMYEMGYFGMANFDFIVDENEEIYVIECNARFSAASSQLIQYNELSGNVEISKLMVEKFLNKEEYKSQFKIFELPKSEFNGSQLSLHVFPTEKAVIIKGLHELGVYHFQNNDIIYSHPDIRNFDPHMNEFTYFSESNIGETYDNISAVGRITSNFQLFDFDGNLNESGAKIINSFNE